MTINKSSPMHTDNTPINKHRICCLKSILSSPEIIILFFRFAIGKRDIERITSP